jgi:hypothetical protein
MKNALCQVKANNANFHIGLLSLLSDGYIDLPSWRKDAV